MGNNIFDLIRKILNWMITADEDVRGQAELVAPDKRERPRSGSRQSESWRRAFRSTFVSRFAESFSRVVNDEEHYADKTF
jgi:hypothetical protein